MRMKPFHMAGTQNIIQMFSCLQVSMMENTPLLGGKTTQWPMCQKVTTSRKPEMCRKGSANRLLCSSSLVEMLRWVMRSLPSQYSVTLRTVPTIAEAAKT